MTGPMTSAWARIPARWRVGLVFAVWAIATIVVVAHHEPWRDEADAWLIARDRSLVEIWRLMRYAGTLIPWYAIQVPFAKAGLPYWFQGVVHWPIAAAMVAVLLFRAPFPLWQRTLAAFGAMIGYEYTTVARAYSMTVLAIFLVCMLWPRRKAGSLALGAAIAFVGNTTPAGFFFGAAVCLVVGFDAVADAWRARRRPPARVVASLAIAAAGMLLALAQLFPAPPDPQIVPESRFHNHQLFVAFHDGLIPWGPVWLRTTGAVLCIAATLWIARKSPRAIVVGVVFAALQSYVFGFVYEGHVRNWHFFLVDLIAVRWIATLEAPAGDDKATRVAEYVLGAQLLAWAIVGVITMGADIDGRFSNAEAMGRYIHEQHLDDSARIAGHRSPSAEAVLPYLTPGVQLYYPSIDDLGTHLWWNEKFAKGNVILSGAELTKRVAQRYPGFVDGDKPVLLLTNYPLKDGAAQGWKLVHKENETVMSANGEYFFLYERAP